jgi:hypothetical protein
MVKGKLSTGWSSWQAYLKGLEVEEAEQKRHQQIMKRVATKMKHRTVAVAVETWIDMVYASKRRKQLLIKTTARIALLKKKSMTSAFLKWQTYWTQMKEERALAWKVLSRLANVKLASAFHSWWLEVKEKKRHGRIMSKIAAKMKNKTVSNAWNKWIETMSEAKQRRLILTRATARMRRRAVVHTFESWSEAVEEIQGRRSRLTRAVTKCQQVRSKLKNEME